MECDWEAVATCRGGGEHSVVDLRSARAAVQSRLEGAQAALRALDALEVRRGVRLTADAVTYGEEGVEDRGPMGISLAVPSLSAQEQVSHPGVTLSVSPPHL